MAIAPVNKFISVAVPVTPGKQKLYEVPTGTSALLLYVQVANVGIGTTFPKVTFSQQRTQRSTGNKRDVRVIKDIEIPPNDAAILVDGRLVLEKTPLLQDKIFIEAKQQGVGYITFVDYDEPTGIVTIKTKEPHPFKAGDPITLAGIALTCKPNQTGITTNIFPDPQQSYIVESIEGFVGTSKTFTSHIGGSTPIGISNKDYSHYYNSAIHYYERSKALAVEVVTAAGTPTGYTKLSSAVGTSYDPTSGQLTVTTSTAHNLSTNDFIRLEKESFAFTCDLDSNATVKKYPRASGEDGGSSGAYNVGKPDYAYGKILEVGQIVDATNFKVFIGTSSNTSTHTYDQTNSLANNIHKIGTRYNVKHAVYFGGGSSRNPDDQIVETYNLRAGELVIKTDVAHQLSNGDKIRIIDNGIIFSCSMDNRETEHAYPRVTDPASDAELTVSGGATGGNYISDANTFVVNVGESKSGGFFAPLEMELIASILENSSA